uniref:Complex 1 LYR protein domain-containing protein n=1 Tax=Oncorhynchus kisutch TaxID=8019 RepID=A0A8C7D9L1_ONCKI
GTMAYPLRSEVVRLYKNLIYLGWEYSKGAGYFRDGLKSAFLNNKDVKDPEMIKQMIYRAMKKRYCEPEE